MRERWLTVENTQSEQAIAGSAYHPKRIYTAITLGLLLADCIGPRLYDHWRNRNTCARQHRMKRTQLQDRSCYLCEQRFAFNGVRPVDISFRAESAREWHGLCCRLVEETGKPRERNARVSAASG